MKKYILLLVLAIAGRLANAQVDNTSYVTSNGEKVLQLSIVLPIDTKTAWTLFTTDEGLKKWIAPVAHIEYASGGNITTNYDESKSLDDKSSIRLPIINYLENELLTLKVNLNDNFPESCRKSDQNLQEILQFKPIDPNHTRIISSMVGWGKGADWDKTYSFFEKGNDYTYREMLKNYNAK
jgi:hypothetical protein